jgi:hypothetical protein
MEADDVEITVTKEAKAGAKSCEAHEWAIVHWKGYENDTMKFVQDSRLIRDG